MCRTVVRPRIHGPLVGCRLGQGPCSMILSMPSLSPWWLSEQVWLAPMLLSMLLFVLFVDYYCSTLVLFASQLSSWFYCSVETHCNANRLLYFGRGDGLGSACGRLASCYALGGFSSFLVGGGWIGAWVFNRLVLSWASFHCSCGWVRIFLLADCCSNALDDCPSSLTRVWHRRVVTGHGHNIDNYCAKNFFVGFPLRHSQSIISPSYVAMIVKVNEWKLRHHQLTQITTEHRSQGLMESTNIVCGRDSVRAE